MDSQTKNNRNNQVGKDMYVVTHTLTFSVSPQSLPFFAFATPLKNNRKEVFQR